MKFVGHNDRTDDGAIAAGRAGALVHKAGFAPHLHMKIAHVAGDGLHFAIGHQFDVGMPTGIHHLGAENSGTTVEGGEGFVELGHPAADGGLSFHQVDLIARIGNIQRGLDAGNPTADAQCGRGDGHLARE